VGTDDRQPTVRHRTQIDRAVVGLLGEQPAQIPHQPCALGVPGFDRSGLVALQHHRHLIEGALLPLGQQQTLPFPKPAQ
jgi:hypothetical protein